MMARYYYAYHWTYGIGTTWRRVDMQNNPARYYAE